MMLNEKDLENITFEKGLERLEQIVDQLNQNNTTLENALKLFEEGICLIRHCNNLLDSAEAKVKILLEDDMFEEIVTEKLKLESN